LVHTERQACAEWLEGLDAEQLSKPSLCDGWTVSDVAAHLVGSGEMTFGGFYAQFLEADLRFDEMVGRHVQGMQGTSAAELADRLRHAASTTNHPPGPVAAMLGEAIVHGEDMRRPLGVRLLSVAGLGGATESRDARLPLGSPA
jgi:uncharacterized protein (TIGR03083 family)